MVMVGVLYAHKRHWDITLSNTSWNTRWRDKGDDLIARLDQLSFVFLHICSSKRYKETCSDCVLDRKMPKSISAIILQELFFEAKSESQPTDSACPHYSFGSMDQLLMSGCLVTKQDQQTKFTASLRNFISFRRLFSHFSVSCFHLFYHISFIQLWYNQTLCTHSTSF